MNDTTSRQLRIAGICYLLTVVARIVGDGVIRDRLARNPDVSVVAANITGNLTMFRAGFVADLVAFGSYAALAAVLWAVFVRDYPVAARVAAFFGLFSATSQGVSAAFHIAAAVLIGNPSQLRGFTVEQVESLAMVSLKFRSILYHNVGLVFLGLFCIVIGWLAMRSRVVPRIVGALLLVSGVAYMPFAVPGISRGFMPMILIPAAIGQCLFTLWLVFGPVNRTRPLGEATAV